MDKQIIDGMKEESKPFRNIMIFCYVFYIVMPTAIYFMKDSGFSNKDLILLIIFWLYQEHLAYMDGYMVLNIDQSLMMKKFI